VSSFITIDDIVERIPARPNGLWTLVAKHVEGDSLLHITASATAQWSYSDTDLAICSADGDPRSLISRARCLAPAAPVGALIGKIGGSTAAASDGLIFVVGMQCTTKVPPEGGPLYLTINDEPGGMDNNAHAMTVLEVSFMRTERTAPQPPPVTGAPTGSNRGDTP
jgi:hypothetical protein